jgi:FkbM family methyltransferase
MPKSSMSEVLKNVVRATVPRGVRNWLRSPRKSAEWLYDSVRYSMGAVRSIQVAEGVRLTCHPHAYKVYRNAQIDDPKQREEFLGFVSRCWAGMLLFDIGAHFGIFSLTAAKLGGTSVAVDPSPISCRMLSCQRMLNECVDKIQVLPAAVSDTDGLIGMLSAGVFTPGYVRVVRGRSKRELTQAHAVTVDEMADRFGVPTHIKIDVEGHELAVLRGARRILRDSGPLLFLELHNEMIRSVSGDPRECLAALDEHGYTIYFPSGEIAENSSILTPPIVRLVGQRSPMTLRPR